MGDPAALTSPLGIDQERPPLALSDMTVLLLLNSAKLRTRGNQGLIHQPSRPADTFWAFQHTPSI